MDGVFLKNDESRDVQVHALGAYFILRAGKATQIVNPFRGKESPSKDLTDDQVADLIVDELTPRGGPTATLTRLQVKKLTAEEVAALSDEDVLTTEELAALKPKRKKRVRKPAAKKAAKPKPAAKAPASARLKAKAKTKSK
jgi:hypothetical protein